MAGGALRSRGSKGQRATRTPTLKQAFKYHARPGHHPRRTCTEVYVVRRDPFYNTTKVAPEMMHSIEANKPPIPLHQLLEDDWRSYRSVLHNRNIALLRRMPEEEQIHAYLQDGYVANSIFELGKNPAQLLQMAQKDVAEGIKGKPRFSVYNNSVDPPIGYVYRRHVRGEEQWNAEQREAEQGAERITLQQQAAMTTPNILIQGPMYGNHHIEKEVRHPTAAAREMFSFDADVIMTSQRPEHVIVYNEPDAVPSHLQNVDFSQTLMARVARAVTSLRA